MKRLPGLAGAVVALVVLFDWLFYSQPIGWTAAAFTLAVWGVLVARFHPRLRTAPFVALCVATFSVAAAMVIHPGRLEIILAAAGLLAMAMVGRFGWSNALTPWLARLVHWLATAWLRPLADLAALHRVTERRGSRLRIVRLRGLLPWLVAVVLASVFVVLFIAANPIVETWADESGTWLADRFDALGEWLNEIDSMRIVQWLVVGCGLWSLLRMRDRRSRSVQAKLTPEFGSRWQPSTDYIIPALVVFNLVFAVQTVLDLVYLWSGADLPDHLTYAEYAQRGAYPLLASALLAGGFVIVAFRDRAAATQHRLALALAYLWLAQNVWLIAGAGRRLALYVDVYSLTRWRVAAAIWMGVVAVYIVLLLIRLARRRSNAWFVRRAALVGIITCLVCVWPNFDGYIAAFNVHHCKQITGEGVPLDVDYLVELGSDALPALRWADDRLPSGRTAERVRSAITLLETQLAEDQANWRGWTWRRATLGAQGEALPSGGPSGRG